MSEISQICDRRVNVHATAYEIMLLIRERSSIDSFCPNAIRTHFVLPIWRQLRRAHLTHFNTKPMTVLYADVLWMAFSLNCWWSNCIQCTTLIMFTSVFLATVAAVCFCEPGWTVATWRRITRSYIAVSLFWSRLWRQFLDWSTLSQTLCILYPFKMKHVHTHTCILLLL